MTNEQEEILDKLKEIVKPYLDGEIPVKEDSHLINDLGLDSIDMVDIILEIEDAFSFSYKFDDGDFNKIKSVKDLVQLIEERSSEYSNSTNIK